MFSLQKVHKGFIYLAQVSCDREARMGARNARKRALSTISSLSPKKIKVDRATSTVSVPETAVDNNEEIAKLRNEIQQLKQTNALHLITIKRTQATLKTVRQSRCLKSSIKTAPSTKTIRKTVNSEVRKVLSKCFTPGQIRCLLQDNNRVKWTSEDIANALTLRAMSKKTYKFLRKRNFPLPAPSTLQKWVRNFKCRRGIVEEVISLLKARATNFQGIEKYCVICFDEMNIDGRICYDSSEDAILGPHSNVQAVMVRGLFSSWKQPIYYDFDVTMTSELLKSIISAVEDCGIHVVAVTCDMGGKNSKVWKELGVNIEKTFFFNPVTNDKVWVFCDIPHLLKLLRNHFLDEGLILPDGTQLSKETIENLLQLQTGDLNITHHINEAHLNVSGRSRQNVRMASQLFSNRTAQAIKYMLNKKQESNFVKLVNDTFDVLNSRMPRDQKTPLRSGYGMEERSQENTLKRFLEVIPSVRVGSRKSMLPFQKGFIISINSLLGLYQQMKTKHDVTYILTSRLNQDCIENFFSRIRGLGAFYNNPTPFEVRNRIRLLLLTGNMGDIPLSVGASVAEEAGSHSTGVLDATFNNNSEEDFMNFVTNELCIDIVETPAVPPTTNSDPEETELLNEEISNRCSSDSDVPQDALKYLAGYVAFKSRFIDDSLGTRGEHLCVTAEMCDDWISIISKGGLTRPSHEWLNKITQFEVIFGSFHGLAISKQSKIISSLTAIIKSKFPEVHEKTISLYVRTRTFIRIRHLNKQLKIKALERHAAKKNRLWIASSTKV